MQTQNITNSQSLIQKMESAIEAYRRGEFLLVSDDEDRENEGDLVIAAEHCDAKAVNFMITHGKGLVCLAITPEMAEQKGLRPMVERNEDHMGTAFTSSVDASPGHGVSTGISAPDRAKSIEVVIGAQYTKDDVRVPGHIFPLVAKAGGVLQRKGHTEAAVELSILAGLKPAGVIVEVIKDDGEMARRPDLEVFAEQHGIRYITIENICEYLVLKSQLELQAA